VKQHPRNVDFFALSSAILVSRVQTSRYPSSSWKIFCIIPMDNSNAADKSRIVAHQSSKIGSSTLPEITSLFDVLGRPVQSWWMFAHPFPTLCTIFWHATHSLHHHYTPLLTGGEFRWEKYVLSIKIKSHYKFLHGKMFPVSLPLHTKLELISLSSDWLLAICCMLPLPSATATEKQND
jgi:hypothetical protein